jgi:hypothetical protein
MLTIAIFDAYGYDTNIPIMAGIACALGLIAQRKRALMKMQTQEKPVPALPPEPALEPAWLSFQ